jgi:putative acetyltransferase
MEKISVASVNIRNIRPEDNSSMAIVIRNTLKEFGANKPGTVYFDPTTDNLYKLFQEEGSMYQIAEHDHQVIGGGGIYPSGGLPEDTCELVKMYLIPEARGIGLGKLMITKCLEGAARLGYKRVYLETMPELKDGFEYLSGPMGNTGHFGCALWMIKEI